MSFIRTHKNYLMVAGAIWAASFVVFLIGYFFVIGPQKDYIKNSENKLAEKKQALASAERASLEETKIQLNEQIERLENRLKDFVIDFEDSANLTFDISQVASDQKVSSFSVKTRDNREPVAIPDCTYIFENYFEISFSGGFQQFATFLNALERHRPVLFIDKFTVVHSRTEGVEYQVGMDVTFLVGKPQEGKTAGGQPAKIYGKKI
jgi:Tfp pilus assembly protein PilO